jgi:peptidoglycan/xylan/chitin deacetylase (PgdA/CDA1 family)
MTTGAAFGVTSGPPAPFSRRSMLIGGAVGAALGLALDVTKGSAARTGLADVAGVAQSADGAAPLAGPPGRLGSRRVIWSTTPDGPFAALTFDDGPTPAYTPRVLTALANAGVPATFFPLGYNVVQHPELMREIASAGHDVGNHTYDHLDASLAAREVIRDDMVRSRDAIEQVVQQPLVGYRPPRGHLTGHALQICAELEQDVVLWSCTRGPGGASTARAVADFVGTNASAGDIVLLHDGLGRGTFQSEADFTRELEARREVEMAALPDILARAADRGITFTTVSDLMARSGL